MYFRSRNTDGEEDFLIVEFIIKLYYKVTES